MRSASTAGVAALVAFMMLPTAAAGPDEAFAGEPDDVRSVLRAVADEIDGQNVYDCIDEITKDVPYSYRVMGTPTQDAFLDRYGDAFSQYGLKSEIQHFNLGKRPWDVQEGPGGANLIGIYEGRDPTKWVVMGGHYDTREATFGGGAHDNGSGICTIQEIARTVATLKPDTEASWVFAWWDGEEWGLFGSRAFVEDHNQTKAMFNLTADTEIQMLQGISVDMAGLVWPAHNPWEAGGSGLLPGAPAVPAPKQHFHLRAPPVDVNESWRDFGSYGSYEKLKERDDFEEILQDFRDFRAVVEEVWRVWLEVPEEHVSFEEDSYGRTDHIPFMSAGVPGLRVQGAHDGEYPCYHQPCDTLEFMTAAAGSHELLVAGMDMETTTTALISTFLAMKGDIVPPGTNATTADNGTALDDPDPTVPSTGGLLVAGGLLFAALAWRRRR